MSGTHCYIPSVSLSHTHTHTHILYRVGDMVWPRDFVDRYKNGQDRVSPRTNIFVSSYGMGSMHNKDFSYIYRAICRSTGRFIRL